MFSAGFMTIVCLFAVAATASGGAAKSGNRALVGASPNTSVSGTVSFDGIWTGSEATDFGDVIAAFNKVYPNVHIDYKPLGNNETTVLATAITGRQPSWTWPRADRRAGVREPARVAG